MLVACFCGREWTSDLEIDVCPFCGAIAELPRDDRIENELQDLLRAAEEAE